jgi:hypothetical protein
VERTYLDPLYPLDGADLRAARGREHLLDIRDIVHRFAHDLRPTGVLAYGDPVKGTFHAIEPLAPPLQLSIRVGEMLYNLRAALDYILHVFLRNALDHEKIAEERFKTLEGILQFPIADSEITLAGWRKRKGEWLREEQFALIGAAQPYGRDTWLKRLGSLYYNLDKHRELQPLLLVAELKGGYLIPIPISSEVPPEEAERMAREKPVGAYRGGSFEVAFSDGAPIVETLEVIQSEVSALIERAYDTLYL